MAGKNRANTLSAILGNIGDLTSAYETAMNAEGSALRENATQMDSIQGRIKQFNNAVQTMWMNFIDSDVIKFIVNVGTALAKLVDKIGVLQSALTVFLTYKSIFSKKKIDFASILGIHDKKNGFVFGKQGLSKSIVNFIGNIKNKLSGIKIGDIASAIKDNIENYATINTSEIDSEIDNIQNKLATAREQLNNAKAADLDYYKSMGSVTPAEDRDTRIQEKTQEVKELETQLTNLQEQRNSMMSSVANDTAGSILEQVDAEKEGYESIFSVLSEIKDVKLSIGDEQDAAKKIDEITEAAKNGQSALANYMQGLGDSDAALKAYIASVDDGNYSLSGFQQFIQQHNAGLQKSTVGAYASAAAHAALNVVLSAGLSLLASFVASGILKLINAEKEAAEAAKEATKDAQKLSEEFSSLEDYKKQIKELRKSLDSNNLSQSEAYDARQKLLTIQDELISKFGLEKEGINLVTGAIEEQIGVIDEYEKKNAIEWLNNNQKSINDAIEFFHSLILGDTYTITNWGPTENVKKMVEAYASYRKYTSTADGWGYQDVKFKGSREEVKSEVEAFQEWLRIKEKEMRDELNELYSLPLDKQTTDVLDRIHSLQSDIDQLQDYREGLSKEHEKWFGEDSEYATNKALMDETKQKTALANYSDQYMKILKAQNDFKEAQAKGDEEGMKEALDALHSATSEAMDDAGEWYMDEFFGELDKEFAAEEFELNVKTDEDGLKTQIQGIIKDSGLSALDNNQIKDMINRGLDVEGAVDESGAYTEEQISGLVELKTTADNAGISIETLISILTNLGLIKGRPAEAINSIESTGKAYSMLASEAEKYNSINETLNESVYDGIKISKDQYEALSELIGAEKEFADCIDTTDGYVIKDIALTKKLVAEKKKELAIETRAAKSRAELQYYDLVDSLGEAIDATGEFSEANETSAASILDEISAVKLAINQYQMLEDSLLGVTSAFDDFANSQEIDSKNTYGSTYVEMAQTMYDAIYKTGEVGTEAFWAAVRANVPSDIYAGLAPGKEQIQAIAKYLNENVFSTLTLSDESFSIDYSDIEDFVEKAQDAGVFTGIDASSFGLSADFLNSLDDGEDALQAFADKLGMTKTQVYAMLSEMDKYNADGIGFSMLFQLDNSTEGNIAVLTSELEKLYIERQKLIKQGADEDILSANSQDILEVKSQLDEVKQQSVEIVMDYAEVDNAIAHTDAKLQDVMSEGLIEKLGLKGDITVGEQLENIQDAMLLLEEPVVMDLETAKKEIEDLEKLNPTIEAHVELGENGKYEIIDSDDFMANGGNIEDLEYYVELKNAESFINTSLEDGLTTTETLLSKINENVAIIAGEEPKSNESEGNESSTGFGGAQRSGGGGQANAGAGGGRLSDYGIDDFRQAIAAKMFDAGFAGNKTAVNALGNLYNQLDYIEQGFNNGESKENVQAQLRELQAEAEKYGVNIPATLQISTEQVELPAVVSTQVEKTEMPVVFDIPIELSDAYKEYQEEINQLKQLGFDPSQTVFGNIDTNNRQVLEWTDENLGLYKDALESWYTDINGAQTETWDDIIGDLAGSVSTVFGSSSEFDGVEIAFSPMLQTENGAVLLDRYTVEEYIWGLIDKAGEGWTNEDLLRLDTEGLEIDGKKIKGLIADVGDTAIQTSEAMHFTGKDGSIAQAFEEFIDTVKKSGISEDEFKLKLADGTEVTINLKAKADTSSAESAGEKVAETAQGAASSMPVIVESETGLSNPNDFKATPVKSYSQLQSDVESFNSILSENEEIIGNNIEVTQEYKESLAELLGVEVKELDKYFDGDTKLLIKNADSLKKLTKEAKNNTKQNIKLAKSQAQLEYVELVNQLDDMLNVTDDLTDKNIDAANSLLSQIDSVQRTILKYQMLEESLLGAADAFKKFESAKEIDSQNTYGDSYIEMAQTIYDAYYKTGEVGSEAVRSAVEALIDPSVYAGLERGSEEYNQAIYDAFNKTVLPTLTLNEDTLSIDYKSVEQFVTNGLGKIFTGTSIKDFDLIDGLNFEDAAKSMGMTTTQLYAMLAALKQFTGRDYLHEFVDGSISGGIMDITSKIEELNREKLELMNDGVTEEEQKRIDEINVALAQNKQELQELGAQAYNTWQEYTKVDGALNVLDEVQDKGQKVSEVFPKDFVTDLGLTGEETVQEAYDALLKKQLELEQPTTLTMTYAIDNIDGQIKELETALETGDYTNIGPISFDLEFGKTPEEQIQERIDALKDEKAAIAVAFNIELSEEERKDLEKQLESIEQFKINDKVFTVTGNTSATMLKLRALKLFLDKIKNTEIKIKTNYSNSGTPNNGGTRVNGTAHVDGTAFKNGSWGAPKDETALVGELGPEMIVRDGHWFTVGDNGAEFTDIKHDDIIFNHKQTEDLLSKGYITGRGKAFAEGTAYSRSDSLWKPASGSDKNNGSGKKSSKKNNSSKSSDDVGDIFDWFEVLLEEINEQLDLMNAKLENAVGISAKNSLLDQIINVNKSKLSTLKEGLDLYTDYSNKLLKEIPEKYRKMAQDGAVAIEEFAGDADKETLEAINNYREWAQKVADLVQQMEELNTEISTLAKQKIDNISEGYENKRSLHDSKVDQYDAYNALLETDLGFESEKIYQAMINENNKNISILKEQRDAMQAELNRQVEAGNIKKYSQDWYDVINSISEVDTEIISLKTDIEDYQDSINELHWDKLDLLLSKLEAVSEEADNLIDVLGSKDLVNKDTGEWTDEGITTLGLYAQKMDAAEVQAKKYEEQIKYLNKNWKKLGYTEQEYVDKLDELKSGQYDAIKAYNDTKDAIVDLNKERVDAIKNSIQKEIDAYEELINKKKEELDSEKDLWDFQKNIKDKQKNISDIQRKLDALSSDNSASARAQRAKLQAELAEAQQDLEDTYYERSISDQQEALDKELENFQDAKQEEMDGWDEYLENTEQVVADSLNTITANTNVVYQTLEAMGQEYGLSITESLISPWKEGENAIQAFSEKFGLAMSATVDELKQLELEFMEIMKKIEESGSTSVDAVKNNASGYQSAKYNSVKQEGSSGNAYNGNNNSNANSNSNSNNNSGDDDSRSYPYGRASETTGNIKKGAKGNKVKAIQYALNQLGYGNSGTKSIDGIFGSGTTSAVKAFQRAMGISADGIVGNNTRAKFKLKGYAKGTTSVNKDQWALLDELGDELVIGAKNGRITYLEKGTSVIPADLTANLMAWGELNPQSMLDQNRPVVNVPGITNNNIEVNMEFGSVVHIDTVTNDTLPNLTKTIEKEMDKYMKGLNSQIRKYVR